MLIQLPFQAFLLLHQSLQNMAYQGQEQSLNLFPGFILIMHECKVKRPAHY